MSSYGGFLFSEENRRDAQSTATRIQSYPVISWDEAIALCLNQIWNTDSSGAVFEGEIEEILKTKTGIRVTCKWVSTIQP